MEREVQLLRLLDGVMGGVFPTGTDGSAAARESRQRDLRRQVNETAVCARELALTGTEAAARRLAAWLELGAWGEERQPQLEEQAEQLQALAERELEARMAGAAPAAAGPGMPWGEFVMEAREHLASIEQELLRLEHTPDDTEAVHSLFRSFHTIKGLAAIAGAGTAREVAHQTESLLDAVRGGARTVDGALIDLTLASADFLGDVAGAAERLDRGEEVVLPEAADALLARLHAALGQGRGGTAAPDRKTAGARPAPARQAAGPAVKVDTAKLDQLVDLVGELVIAQSLVQMDRARAALDEQQTGKNLNQLRRITAELQKTAMALRVVPVGQTFQRMARVFRDLVRESDKLAVLELAGEEAELDRTIVERLAGPLMHMIRNAVDHGLEYPGEREKVGKPAEGKIRLSASHQSGYVVIEVSDDGKGLEAEQIRRKAIAQGLVHEQDALTASEVFELIFQPGFSTSEQVTTLSGRGVGMDVVWREIESLRGRVEVRSEAGKGTTFLLRVPLTLAIIDALVVRHNQTRYILPLYSVREILKPGGQVIYTVEGRQEVVLLRDQVLPVRRMEALLGAGRGGEREESLLVVVETGTRRVALAVDEVVGKQEVVIKSLGDWMGRIRGVAGGAILGDGSVGIILDVDGMMGQDGYGLAA